MSLVVLELHREGASSNRSLYLRKISKEAKALFYWIMRTVPLYFLTQQTYRKLDQPALPDLGLPLSGDKGSGVRGRYLHDEDKQYLCKKKTKHAHKHTTFFKGLTYKTPAVHSVITLPSTCILAGCA